jgi:hypothetical protein
MIDTIDPTTLFPIHTEHPALFSDLTTKTQIVEEGKAYKI